LIFPLLWAFYDCLKHYFHNIEFRKEQILLGFKDESLTLNLLILIAKHYIYINVNYNNLAVVSNFLTLQDIFNVIKTKNIACFAAIANIFLLSIIYLHIAPKTFNYLAFQSFDLSVSDVVPETCRAH
jgi:hypothetical protein